MNSFIVISKNPDQQQTYINTFTKEHSISPFDTTTIKDEGSVGIEIVRKIQEKIYLKPYQGKEKIIVIQNAQNLTDAAQNAMLKILEEPPLDTYIFLSSTTEDAFLPTILSRCNIIKLHQLQVSIPRVENTLEEYLQILLQGTIGEKLNIAEKLAADKENVPGLIEQLTLLAREKMIENIENPTLPYAVLLAALQEAYKNLTTTNVNPRTILEHYFLTI